MANNESLADRSSSTAVKSRMGRRRSSVISWKARAISKSIVINGKTPNSDKEMFDQLESPTSMNTITVGSATSDNFSSFLELNEETNTRLSPYLIAHDLQAFPGATGKFGMQTSSSPIKAQSLQSIMATSPYTMHMLNLENVYTRDFLCCGRTWDSYHDLLQHHEDCHGADFENMDADVGFESHSMDSDTHNHPSAGVMLGFPQSSVSSHNSGFLPSPPNSRASSPTRKALHWHSSEQKSEPKTEDPADKHLSAAVNHHYDGWVSQQMAESTSTESEDCEMGATAADNTIKLFRNRAPAYVASNTQANFIETAPHMPRATPHMLTSHQISQMASYASAAFQAANFAPLRFQSNPGTACSHTETSEDDGDAEKAASSSIANFVGISLSPSKYGSTLFPNSQKSLVNGRKVAKKPGHRPTPKLKHHRQAPNTSMLTNNARSGVISTPTLDSGASLSSDSDNGGFMMQGVSNAAVSSKSFSNIVDRSILYPAGGRFRCPFQRCNEKRFPNAVEWRHHIRNLHQQDLPHNDFEELYDRAHECLAPGCGRRYKNTSGFKYHMLSTHGVDYEC